ncbi:hypothetical protein DXJ58_04085 [Vibrio fluvialis]|nr:hypothetical protein [Vibrio fluvialis]EKO3999400.1 hypothetical protein [Vibrio fluvialis]
MGRINAFVGVIWRSLIQTGIIFFDAIYSGVSILLSMMTMYALAIISKGNLLILKNIEQVIFTWGERPLNP